MEAATQFDLSTSARWIGRFRYLELALFEILGERSKDVSSNELALFLSSASAAHGYRAGLFEALLPVSDGLDDAVTLTVSPSPAIDGVTVQLKSLDGADLVGVLVDVIYEQSRRGLAAYLCRLTSAQDAPLILAIRRVLFDMQLIVESAAMLSLRSDSSDSAVLSEVETAILAAGGLYGQKNATAADL